MKDFEKFDLNQKTQTVAMPNTSVIVEPISVREGEKERFGEWISVKDRLPINEGHVLITGNNTVYIGFYFFDTWNDLDGRTVKVTHWMELPKIPTKD